MRWSARIRRLDPVQPARIDELSTQPIFGQLFDEIVRQPFEPSAPHASRSRFRWRGVPRHRGRVFASLVAVVAVAIVLVVVLPSTPGPTGDAAFGLQIDSRVIAPTVQQPTFILNAFSVGFVPSGYALKSSSRVTDSGDPLESVQFVNYKNAAGSSIQVQIEPVKAIALAKLLGPPTKGQSETAVQVNGRPADLRVSDLLGNRITSSTPCSILTPPKQGPTPHAEGLMTWEVPSQTAGVDFKLTVFYSGSSLAGVAGQLRAVADAISVHGSSWSCWDIGGRDRLLRQDQLSGGCSAGEIDSPTYSPPRYAGTIIATGSYYGSKWAFEVGDYSCPARGSAPPRSLLQYSVNGANGVGCGGLSSDQGANNAIIVSERNLPNGHRIACGVVPADITSLTVASSSTTTAVTERVLPKRLFGHAYFVLSLGRSGEGCYFLCTNGALNFKFYDGAALISSNTMSGQATEGSTDAFPIQK